MVEPLDWHPVLNGPSERQRGTIEQIVQDRRQRLADVLPYSAKVRYSLQALFTALIEACPEDRAWLLSGLKHFGYDGFLTPQARQALNRQAEPVGGVLSRVT
ncbi:hypothetical protein [Dactylosporangium sp. NPDC049140]|uniref:hypothetical protein n=1 Tax=Dactylosporangium sp. NPDC049140 TaxID=3155647 RepID=UPI0033E3C0F0